MKLAIEDEAGTRSIVPFTTDGIVVGRGSEGVTFRLADRNVSRRHARFLRQNGAVFVEDLGSLTGTRVNGERISGKRRLRDGDLVQIGDYDLAVLAEGEALAPGAPPPLPAPIRSDAATTQKLPAYVEPTPAAVTPPVPPPAAAAPPPPSAPVAAPARARTFRIAVVVALVALVAGLVAGWMAGAITSVASP
jgi:predicted component of type VI protein secretion system